MSLPNPRLLPVLVLATSALAAGCQYDGLGADEAPAPGDAWIPPIETDVDLEGYFFLLVNEQDPAGDSEYECQLTEYVEGVRTADFEDNSCFHCDRFYVADAFLLPGEQGDNCDIASGFPFLEQAGREVHFGLVSIADGPDDYSWLADYGYTDLLYANFTPAGVEGDHEYGFYMYGYPTPDVLEGEQYRAGEYAFQSYYYYRLDGEPLGQSNMYAIGLAYLGTYN